MRSAGRTSIYNLLDAGITVISPLNIQHLESLNDVVAGVTGIKVRETVPDKVVDDADEVEVVAISPQALRSRMRHGNIYPPDQSERALEGFFREGNLDALRELVLKRVVHEVEQDLTEYMHEHGLQGWEAAERCIVILENTPDSEVALRRAWRMARAFNGDLTAVYPACLLKEQGMTHLLAVATDLNIALRETAGEDFVREISDLIRAENIVHVTVLAGHEGRFLGLRRGLAGGRHSGFPPACGCSPCRTRRRLTGPLAEGRVRQSGWARSDLGALLGKLWHPRPHAQRRFLDRDLGSNLCREMQSKPIGATNPPVFRLQGCLSSSSKSRKISALAQMGEVCQPPVVSAQNTAIPAPPAAQVAQTLSKHEPQSGAALASLWSIT